MISEKIKVIKEKSKIVYKKYLKGNMNNIVVVICISGFIFGFSIGSLMTGSEKVEKVAKHQEASSKKVVEISDEDRIKQISKAIYPSMVVVKNKIYINNGEEKVLVDNKKGCGVIYSDEGYVVTNQEAVQDASVVSVVLEGGHEYKGEVVGTDEKSDLAVIKINKKTLKQAEFGGLGNLKDGDKIISVGSSQDEESLSLASWSKINSTERNVIFGNRDLKLIETDGIINSDNNGGVLVNKEGQVIGINTFKMISPKSKEMSFAIPMNTAKPIIDDIIENGFIKRASIGAKLLEIEDVEGVRVDGVIKDGPADKGKLLKQDIIIKVGDAEIKNISDISKVIESTSSKKSLELTILREKQKLKRSVTLDETSKSSLF